MIAMPHLALAQLKKKKPSKSSLKAFLLFRWKLNIKYTYPIPLLAPSLVLFAPCSA
jgi:hypothetical protein